MEKIFNVESFKIKKDFVTHHNIDLSENLVLVGVPGSGKMTIMEKIIEEFIQKGFSICTYDYKYPTLSQNIYNHFLSYKNKYKNAPKFFSVNFKNPFNSSRCNPISTKYLKDINDAKEISKIIVNSSFKEKDNYFKISSIDFILSCIWTLKIIETNHKKNNNKEYLTLPHLIELFNLPYDELFQILKKYGDEKVAELLFPYCLNYEKKEIELLEAQIGNIKNSLSRLSDPLLYWITSKDEVPFEINNAKKPILFCIGNQPEKKLIYDTAISLINFRIMKTINKINEEKINPSLIFINECNSFYLDQKLLDNLIKKRKNNKTAVCLSLTGLDKSEKITRNIGNIVSGKVHPKTFNEVFKKMEENGFKNTISDTENIFFGILKHKPFKGKIDFEKLKIKQKNKIQPIPKLKKYEELNVDDMKEIITKNFHQIKKDIEELKQ